MPTFWITLALGSLLAVAAAVAFFSPAAGQAAAPQTGAVARRDIARRIAATGVTRPTAIVHVGALVSGIISSTAVQSGDRVQAGQVIATIEDSAFRLQLARAEAQWRAARLRHDEARRHQRRQEDLLAQGFVAAAAVDAARSQARLAGEDVVAAAADVETARVNLAHCRIASPISGTVLSKEIATGQSVASAFQVPDLFTIVSRLDRLEVVAMFAESDLASVTIGAPATLTVPAWPERTFTGTVTRVQNTPETRQGVVMFPVVLAIANDEGLLRPGMTAYVELRILARRNVLTVPNQALSYARARDRATGVPPGAPRHVYVRSGNETMPIAVKLGEADEAVTEIIPVDPLAEHAQVLLKEAP
jgi:HlyD family secretion protein